jgi:hypothetical protein
MISLFTKENDQIPRTVFYSMDKYIILALNFKCKLSLYSKLDGSGNENEGLETFAGYYVDTWYCGKILKNP